MVEHIEMKNIYLRFIWIFRLPYEIPYERASIFRHKIVIKKVNIIYSM